MAQLSDDSFAAGETVLSVDAAVRLLFERVPGVPDVERVSLFEAEGRVLAEPVVATFDLPAFDNSAVDGFAVRFADLAPGAESVLAVGGRITAGASTGGGQAPRGEAIRIFTGAPLPPGFDTVFMQEDCRLNAEGEVVLPAGLAFGANARRAGEDVGQGACALAQGVTLAPEHLALAAALGRSSVTVRRRLRVALLSTGNEITNPGEPLAAAGVYDANRYLLAALLRRRGADVTDLGILPDDQDAIGAALSEAAEHHDLVLSSGGASVGEEDHVKAAIRAVGSLVFWRLALKPGRAVALGVIGGTPYVGLPGNPVAAFVTFVTLVRPLLAARAGALWSPPVPLPIPCGFCFAKKKGRREYVRARLAVEEGRIIAQPHPVAGTGVITSLTATDGLVALGEDLVLVEPGQTVGFLPYDLLR